MNDPITSSAPSGGAAGIAVRIGPHPPETDESVIRTTARRRAVMSKTLHLTVAGMTCGGCENAVKRALGQIQGVEHVSASHAKNEVDVTFDDARVTPDVVRQKIETLGYKVAS
jgi:copper chaperone